MSLAANWLLSLSQNLFTSIYVKLSSWSFACVSASSIYLKGIFSLADIPQYVFRRCSAFSYSRHVSNVAPLGTALRKQRNIVPRASRLPSLFLAITLYYWRHFPDITNVFQIWSTLVTGFEPSRTGEIFWKNNNTYSYIRKTCSYNYKKKEYQNKKPI